MGEMALYASAVTSKLIKTPHTVAFLFLSLFLILGEMEGAYL